MRTGVDRHLGESPERETTGLAAAVSWTHCVEGTFEKVTRKGAPRETIMNKKAKQEKVQLWNWLNKKLKITPQNRGPHQEKDFSRGGRGSDSKEDVYHEMRNVTTSRESIQF